MSDVVVVGNGVAGYACAARLAEGGSKVTMIGPGLPHDRPPLSKRALATGRPPLLATAEQLVERGIVHLDGAVTRLDLERRRLFVEPAGGGEPVELEAGHLVWATGLRYPKPPFPGFEDAYENTSAAALSSLVKRLATGRKRTVVVGAGLIGTETAATLARAHDVTLLDMVDRPLARLLPLISEAASATLQELGVRFVGECRIESTSVDADGAVVHTATHGDLPFDLVISAAGFRTSLPPELAGDDMRALTLAADEELRVIGHDSIWACGDCVSFPHPRWGRIGIPHWDHARASGRHVADSIRGSRAPYVREPYFFSDIGRLRVQQVGVPDAAVEWRVDDGLFTGLAEDGAPACVVLLNRPARLREAREAVAWKAEVSL